MNKKIRQKAPEFKKVIRGYDIAEVDAYIAHLNEKYEEQRRAGAELEKKINLLIHQYDEYKDKEAALEKALSDIDNRRAAMESDARRQCSVMLDETRNRCRETEQELKKGILRQRDAFVKMHEMVLAFRSDVFEKYSAQIDSIDSIASLADAYDEAMMFCMKKSGIDGDVKGSSSGADKSGELNSDNKIMLDSEASVAKSEDASHEDTALYDKNNEMYDISEENFPKPPLQNSLPEDAESENTADPLPATGTDLHEAAGEYTDSVNADDPEADGMSADGMSTADMSANDISVNIEAEAFDSDYYKSDDSQSEDAFSYNDFSFDNQNPPDIRQNDFAESLPDNANANEDSPYIDADGLSYRDIGMDEGTSEQKANDDFDIYSATGDQLLEMIYGRSPSAKDNTAAEMTDFSITADDIKPDDDSSESEEDNPFHGVDYSFADPDDDDEDLPGEKKRFRLR